MIEDLFFFKVKLIEHISLQVNTEITNAEDLIGMRVKYNNLILITLYVE
jgi:hypothetical protein